MIDFWLKLIEETMDNTFILEMMRQLTERIGRLESQQFYLLATSVFTLIGIIVNLYISILKRRNDKRGDDL